MFYLCAVCTSVLLVLLTQCPCFSRIKQIPWSESCLVLLGMLILTTVWWCLVPYIPYISAIPSLTSHSCTHRMGRNIYGHCQILKLLQNSQWGFQWRFFPSCFWGAKLSKECFISFESTAWNEYLVSLQTKRLLVYLAVERWFFKWWMFDVFCYSHIFDFQQTHPQTPTSTNLLMRTAFH